jgi:hypothetical protein
MDDYLYITLRQLFKSRRFYVDSKEQLELLVKDIAPLLKEYPSKTAMLFEKIELEKQEQSKLSNLFWRISTLNIASTKEDSVKKIIAIICDNEYVESKVNVGIVNHCLNTLKKYTTSIANFDQLIEECKLGDKVALSHLCRTVISEKIEQDYLRKKAWKENTKHL